MPEEVRSQSCGLISVAFSFNSSVVNNFVLGPNIRYSVSGIELKQQAGFTLSPPVILQVSRTKNM